MTIGLFYVLLYMAGLIFLLPLSKKISIWVITAIGFPTGLILWIFSALIVLIIGLPFNWLWMALLLILTASISAAIFISQKPGTLSKLDLSVLLTGMLSVIILSFSITNKSYVFATADSFSIIFHARVLAKSGLVTWAVNQFTEWGVVVPVIQMTGSLFKMDFITGYQTLLSVSLLAILGLSIFFALKKHFSVLISLVFSGSLGAVMISKIYQVHTFYIHNNLVAGVFMFVGLYGLWNFIQKNENEWLILGSIFLTAFGFSRIEAPLYVILFMILALSIKRFNNRQALILVLPYSILALGWHLSLLTSGGQNQLLSNNNILIILAGLAVLQVFTFINQKLPAFSSIIPEVIISSLGFGLVLTILVEPDHMITSLTHFWQNLLDMFAWGGSWIVVVAFIPFYIIKTDQSAENKFLGYSTFSYILLILIIAIARIPYRLGETDSANRLMLQILPVIIFLIASNAETLKLWFSAPSASSD